MMRRMFGDVCVFGLAMTVFVACTTAVILGESGNSTIASFVMMLGTGVLAGWKLDQLTKGQWQLYRKYWNWHPPFYYELVGVLIGAVIYAVDAAMLMRSTIMDVTVEHVAVWLMLTIGMGASLSRALVDRKKKVTLGNLKAES